MSEASRRCGLCCVLALLMSFDRRLVASNAHKDSSHNMIELLQLLSI
ncbi:hypothetical protein PT7_0220 [Pusillimonas sp. T7-7]|nr:hypothetical protein PT7_0220 [Pusillimonas sp. T7-7]